MFSHSVKSILAVTAGLCLGVLSSDAQKAGFSERNNLLNDNWKFFRGGALGADKTDYDDSFWRTVDVPHDYSVEDLPATGSPFDRGALSQVNGGFTTGGTGWYRKNIHIPANLKGKRIVLQFDGVYMNSDVFVNGKRLGNQPNGYIPFVLDATSLLKFDTLNQIVVRAKNEGDNSRWYTGSGIYRNVWLKVVEPIHIDNYGVHIQSKVISPAFAQLSIETLLSKKKEDSTKPVDISYKIIAPNKSVVAEARISQTSSHIINNKIDIAKPVIWDIDAPQLYQAQIILWQNGKAIDSVTQSFGIRTIAFSTDKGFQLNGKTVKLKGGCIHHDNYFLGAKVYGVAEERKVRILKEAGYNAIRTSHNPMSSELLEACDKYGMLVVNEAFDMWSTKKTAQDYHLYFNEWWKKDLTTFIKRDRNHPSVIMWSTGNEIPNRDKPEVVAISQMLTDFVHSMDSTRAVTCGVNGVGPDKDPFFATLDVGGYNYNPQLYAIDAKRVPNRIIYGSESFVKKSFQYWMGVLDHPQVIGDFVWTAWDYIGEASIGWLGYPQRQAFYPWNLAYTGEIDVLGHKRPAAFYREALWKENAISVFVKSPELSFDTAKFKEFWSEWEAPDVHGHWNWSKYTQPLDVEVYSSCDEVELFLNNKSLGKKPTNRSTEFKAIYQVPFAAGELKAVGYKKRKKISESILKTADAASNIVVKADKQILKANNLDVSFIDIELTDNNGVINPFGDNELTFKVTGSAELVAVGNGDPQSVESYQKNTRKAWRGKAQIVVKSGYKPGKVTVEVSGKGFASKTIELAVQ